MSLKAPRGTKDILPSESYLWQYMETTAKKVFDLANYQEIRTPIFEDTQVFLRGVGDTTDIVNKEMYTFEQSNRSFTLKPENTAGVARSYVEHGMHRLPSPLKLWYLAPMFRYERPQAGRQRQFHQVGVELLGATEPSADAEAIMVAMEFLKELKVEKLSLEINSIGCPECRNEYRENIKKVTKPYLNEFCEDCNERYEKNPLRMLDCKNKKCKELMSKPEIQEVIGADFICNECKDHFEKVKEYLDSLSVEYVVNKQLVRGLDYYTRTVFEITSNALGSQNAVCGGGRYDHLLETIGGMATPAVGWAMGMERLLTLIPKPEMKGLKCFVVSNNTTETMKLIKELRENAISCDFDVFNKKFGKQFEKASKLGVKHALILGDDEINENKLTIKNLETREQETLSREDAIVRLK